MLRVHPVSVRLLKVRFATEGRCMEGRYIGRLSALLARNVLLLRNALLGRGRLRRALLGAALVGVVLGMVSSASAQEETRAGDQAGGMDTHLFRPAVDSKGFITVNGSDVLGANNLS